MVEKKSVERQFCNRRQSPAEYKQLVKSSTRAPKKGPLKRITNTVVIFFKAEEETVDGT